MNSKLKLLALASALAVISQVPVASAAPAEREVDQSDNVKLIANFEYKNEDKSFFGGGTDMAFQGKYVYAMQQGAQGGVHVFKHSKSGTPKKISFIPCPGEQNDVASVKPGLIALATHSSQCGGGTAGGVRLLDVSNPKQGKQLGVVDGLPGGSHTLTVYPGTSIIYASPGGLANGGGTEQIIDASNPAKPEVAATFTPQKAGCHDLEFYIGKDKKIAVCAGAGETQIWDVSDPLAPVTIAHIPNPANQFNHSAAISHDGNLLIVGDEAIAGSECVGGPSGALFSYDITNPTLPILKGYFGIDRGPLPAGSSNVDRNTWCSSHLFNFVPGTYTLVSSWYAAGMNVIDFSNPTTPKEIAHYMGEGDDITNYWSAYWFDGRIYANDRVKGLDVFEVKGLAEKGHNQ